MAEKTLQMIREERLKKADKLRELGINPYPPSYNRTHSVNQSLGSLGKVVSVAGRLMSMRTHGAISFADLQDETGKIQLFLKRDTLGDKYPLIDLIEIGDILGASGEIVETSTGQISIAPTSLTVLSKAIRPLPTQWYGLKDTEERFRKRYLDLIANPEVKKRFEIRSAVIKSIRNFLDNREFIEVETPTLQPIYGGGFARPFSTHHNALDSDFYLRISDEMYLKRLIVGGFEKVYEITKVFRNEGVDYDHNPEFTMFEAMITYQDYRYGMDLIEEIIEKVALEVLGSTKLSYQGTQLEIKRPWERYRVVEAINKLTGIDPLTWKSPKEAKEAVLKLGKLTDAKQIELDKMSTIGQIIAFTFEEYVEDRLIQPTIIYDYPIEVSPLSKKCDDPRFTQRFEMFAFGSELGNNYTELNDPVDLKQRFVEEKKKKEAGFEEAHQTDNDYLEAIEHGFPPTCGIAIGIDRLVMMLTDAPSIKEVILFPTMRPEK